MNSEARWEGDFAELRHLIAQALGASSRTAPDDVLRLAIAHRLPLEETARATGLLGDARWSESLAAERAALHSRAATFQELRRALGSLCEGIAVAGLHWRPVLGADIDLLVTDAHRAEVQQRLADGGFVPVGWHAGPGRSASVAIRGGRVVDLVDVERLPADDLDTGPWRVAPREATNFAGIRREAGAERLARAVMARSVVRLRDLMDARTLRIDSLPRPRDRIAARGWDALAAAEKRLPHDGMPVPVAVPRDRVLLRNRLRHPVRAPMWRSVRVVLTGATATDSAAELAADLRRASLDVVAVSDPSSSRYLRAAASGLRRRAIVIISQPDRVAVRRVPGAASLVIGPDVSSDEVLAEVLRLLAD